MIPKDFNIEEFATDLSKKAETLFPAELPDDLKQFVVKVIYDFIKIARNALNKDSKKYNKDETILICQLIAEWMYHKGIDNYKNNIPDEYWEPILQQIAFAIFEKIKDAVNEGKTQNEVIDIAENTVNTKYKELIEQLEKENQLTKSVDEIMKQSSLHDYVKQKSDSAVVDINLYKNPFIFNNKKQFAPPKTKNNNDTYKIDYNPFIKHSFLTCFYLFIFIISLTCLIVDFFPAMSHLIHSFIQHNIHLILWIGLFLSTICLAFMYLKYLIYKDCKKLEQVKLDMRKLVNPDRMYDRLGVDILLLEIGEGLISIADPEQEGQLIPKYATLRQKLTDELGYIVPNCRIRDDIKLGEYEYVIKVRGNIVATGEVYPKRLMVITEQWESKGLPIPQNVITSTEPTHQESVYWMLSQDIPQNQDLTAINPTDVIITHLEACVIKYVDDIMCENDIIKLMDLVKSNTPSIVDKLVPNLISTIDLRKILVNLIREEVSIKDIVFIIERLCDYARFTREPDILSERLRTSLSRQICLKHANEHSVLYTITLSDEWEKLLDNVCQRTELGTLFLLNPMQVQELLDSTANTLIKAHELIGEQPVVLCSPRIRLPLFQLLVRHFPTIVVISYSELITDIRVEALGTIKMQEND